MQGTENAHVDTSHGSGLQGKEHGVVGQEVRCLNVDITVRSQDGAHHTLHDFRIVGNGSAGHHLRQTFVALVCNEGRVVGTLRNQRAIHEIPVYQEGTLQGIYRTARQP